MLSQQFQKIRAATVLACLVTAVTLAPGNAGAQAIRTNVGFTASGLADNDDESSGFVSFFGGSSVSFLGGTYSGGWINNNGNVTLDDYMSTYTPVPILGTGQPLFAPFWADVDTRGTGSGLVTWGNSTIDGRAAFGVNWFSCASIDCTSWNGVGYYGLNVDKKNVIQFVIIDRSDRASGDFDFEFNYGQIQWETGDASGGVEGLGGYCAAAGYSNGTSESYEFAGSRDCGAFLDNAATGLVNNSNVGLNGRYAFTVAGGEVSPGPAVVPEPSSILLIGSGLAGVGVAALRRRLKK
jgi:hypothetical protein